LGLHPPRFDVFSSAGVFVLRLYFHSFAARPLTRRADPPRTALFVTLGPIDSHRHSFST
jgi:hypothetical protein